MLYFLVCVYCKIKNANNYYNCCWVVPGKNKEVFLDILFDTEKNSNKKHARKNDIILKTLKRTESDRTAGLSPDACSRARSHYCSTRELLPAVSPPWVDTFLLRQPGPPGLHRESHIDAELSADARSTQTTLTGGLPAVDRPQTRPPSSWITGVRHDSRPIVICG